MTEMSLPMGYYRGYQRMVVQNLKLVVDTLVIQPADLHAC